MVRLYKFIMWKKRERFIARLISNGLKLGKDVEIIDTFFFDPSHCFLISIGDRCTICPNVRLIAHDASTKKHLGYTKIGKIDIKEVSFLGDSVVVLPDVTIGPYTIVGAGSVVTRDIPPRTVAAGNPARAICSLEEYLERIKVISADKKIFDESYYINRLDDKMRHEIIDSLRNSIGFIV